MRVLIPCLVVCTITMSGLGAQERNPVFETGNQIDSKLASKRLEAIKKQRAEEKEAKDQAAKLRIGSWMEKKFWFVPNQKGIRLLRYGFAIKLEKDTLKASALVYPTGIVSLKVLSRETYVNPESDGYTYRDPNEGDYLKIRFDDGPEAYILENIFLKKLSGVTPESLPKRLIGNEVSNLKALLDGDENATEEILSTDPIPLIRRYDEAWKKQESADGTKVAQKSKKKTADAGKKMAAYSGATGGVEIRLSGGVVRAGMTSDAFVAIVPASAVLDQRVTPDTALPGSLKIWKDCRIQGKEFTVILCRITDPGPYFVASVIPK